MENTKTQNTKKEYKAPNLGNFTIVAAVPLVAPLAIASVTSAVAFGVGLAGGAAAAAWAFGNNSNMKKTIPLNPVE